MSSVRSQQRVMIPPINLLFKFLQQHTIVQIWLYEQVNSRIQGKIRGFDEFMNLVIDDAVEISLKKNTKRQLGTILLKGDNITLVTAVNEE